MRLTEAQARALEAAARGELKTLAEAPGFAAGGKTYAAGGTVQTATIAALRASQPPLLADGAEEGPYVALNITAAGRAALAEFRSPPRHVGKARPR